MEPAATPDEKQTQKKAVVVAPPVVAPKMGSFKQWFARTGSVFTAEYVIFLIAFGVVLSNLTTLVYIFFGLIVDTMSGGVVNAYLPTHLFTLWLMISSLVALPVAVGLWCRIQGELSLNKELKGDLPKGAAKGFRTFWIILNGLGIIGMLMAALYAPLVALIGGVGAPQALLSVTIPSLIGVGVSVLGIFIATRTAGDGKKIRLWLWALAGLITLLFAVNYLWGSSLHGNADSRTTRPYSAPSTDYDAYDDLYDDTYYDYQLPSDYQ